MRKTTFSLTTLPMTFPMFIWTFNLVKLNANKTSVSHAVFWFISESELLESKLLFSNSFSLVAFDALSADKSIRKCSALTGVRALSSLFVALASFSAVGWVIGFVLMSPRKRRRTIRRRYHAFGNARISVSRRMSYLNDAVPMSTIVENRTIARCSLDFLKFVSK